MNPLYLILLFALQALQSLAQDASPPVMMMPLIDQLNVKCGQKGITVEMTFTAPFSGTVFSKGHFVNPDCRYVYQSGGDRFEFTIPSDKCGTEAVVKNGKRALQNLIVIQGDVNFLEIWDSSRKISCEMPDAASSKTVLQRFRVSMLDFEEVHFPGELSDVTARMKLLEGEWPDVHELQDVVRIGDPMTVCIEVENANDLATEVRNCFAYDSSDLNLPTTKRIQLTDDRGCTMKNKLFGAFHLDNSSTPQKHIHISIMNAFTFPDSMDVFLSCEIEICKGGCATCHSQPEPITVKPCSFDDPVDSRCPCSSGDKRALCNLSKPEPCKQNDPVDKRCPCVTGDQRPGCTTTSTTTTTTTTTTTPRPCRNTDPVDARCPCVSGDNRSACTTTTTTSTTTTTTTTTTTPKPCGFNDIVSDRCPCTTGDQRPGCTTTVATPKPCGLNDPVDSRCPCGLGDNRPLCTTTTTTTPKPCGNDDPVDSRCPCKDGDQRYECAPKPCGINDPVDKKCPCVDNDPRSQCTTTTTTTTPKPKKCGPFDPVDDRCPCKDGDTRSKCRPSTPSTSHSVQCEANDPRPQCDINHAFHSRPKPKPKPKPKTRSVYRKKRSLTKGQDNVGITLLTRFRVSSQVEA